MTEEARHLQMAEDLLKRFVAAMRSVHLYSADHPLVGRALEHLMEALDRLHAYDFRVVIGIVGNDLVVGATPIMGLAGIAEAMQRLRAAGVEKITIERGAALAEIRELVLGLGAVHESSAPPFSRIGRHIRVGRLQIQRRIETEFGNHANVQQLYGDTVARAEDLWNETALDGSPDPETARGIVEGLAQALAQNRAAMLALTALRRYDNYTFTHMVNVCILTMSQARSLGIDGALLRQFGLAGLMHDIGKIRVPAEILTKGGDLTDQEFGIIKRHPVDGAEILRRQQELPPLTAAVALEHHLRLDGTGYPRVATRSVLNIATQLCTIADVYDAMRSKRCYQDAQPTERILAVLQQAEGHLFDPHLVRRFSQLMGIYPPGTVVRVDTGDMAVVLRPHAPDPRRPTVRVVADAGGVSLAAPYDVALWAQFASGATPANVTAVLDPQDIGIDPFTLLDAPAA